MKLNLLPFFAVLTLAQTVFSQDPAAQSIVSRDIGDPVMNLWKPDEWVTAGGDVVTLDENDRPDDPEAPRGARGLRFEIRYAANAFGGWNVSPAEKTLPGRPVKFTGWARKGNDASWGMEFSFVDANGSKFNLSLHPYGEPNQKFDLTGEWKRFEMAFPENAGGKPLAYPVKFESVSQNNWGDKNNPKPVTRQFDLYDFRLHTDMEGVAREDRPYGLSMTFPAVGNVFYAGKDRAEMVLSAYSWLGEKVALKTEAKIIAADGSAADLSVPALEILDSASVRIPLPLDAPGASTVVATVRGFPEETSETHRYAVVLPPPELTPEEKKASAYGINVHGGTYVGYEKFARLGFVWVRDYAYSFQWMNNARGEGAYAGWPWYPKILKSAEDNGLLTLPCLMGAIVADNEKPETATPSVQWRRDMARIVATFGSLTCFELDNERQLSHGVGLDAYGAYHQAFAEIMKTVRPDALSVMEGEAGISVNNVEWLVKKGYFKDIDVVNGHRYCGIDNPERSKANLNTGMSEAKKTYLRDVWRHWKKAACCDGRDRQLWLTEWGWDTRAGQIVTEWEQAAYMQREWVLSMGAGIDKMFWYWYYDSDTDTPKNFFDGCGVYDRFHEPKPVAAAFSALRAFLPARYEYLGYANLGENHMAHVLKVDGKLVGLAFKIDREGADLEIRDPKAEKVCDMFGAPVKAGRRTLDIAPTWYIGLDANCDWLKQCPMDLLSDFYVRSVPGEAVEVRTVPAEGCIYCIELPDDWSAAPVEEGGWNVFAPEGLTRGDARFAVVGLNGGAVKRMPVEVDIVPQAYVRSYAAGFDGAFKVEVVNQSAHDQVFTVRGNLPAGWTIEPAEQKTESLEPETKGTLSFKLVASKQIPATEENAIPKLEIVNSKGEVIDYAPVIPREWTMPRVDPKKIAFDGSLSDWPAKNQLPRWMFGPRGDKELSRAFLGYADDGLYIALEVEDSKCYTSDPNSFWRAADCLELGFHAPRADFENGWKWASDDCQFWFCPLESEKRVFAGFWGNCEGQKNDADMKDVKNGLRKTENGFVMELFIPAGRLPNWNPAKGGVCGMLFRFNVIGHRDERQVYWPESDYAIKQPWKWAKVTLGE